jgi:hypothetical protein
MTKPKIEAPGFPPDFHRTLGIFHGMWMMFDVTLDYSIGMFLKCAPIETHILLAGMEFGRKLRLVVELAKRSEHPKKSILVESVRKLQTAKREIITHSYIASNEENITFVNRGRGGEFKTTRTEFTMEQFSDHVRDMVEATQKYQRALGATMGDLLAFAIASFSESQS